MFSLSARIAVHEQRGDDAQALLDQLVGFEDLLSYQDRIRLDVLRNRVALMAGRRDEAIAGLRGLAEQAQASGNMGVAAEIWRLVAESLAG